MVGGLDPALWMKRTGRYLTNANRFSDGSGIVGPSENPAEEYINPAEIAADLDWTIRPTGVSLNRIIVF